MRFTPPNPQATPRQPPRNPLATPSQPPLNLEQIKAEFSGVELE